MKKGTVADRIAKGLKEAIAIKKGRALPARVDTYRFKEDGKVIKISRRIPPRGK